MVREKIEQYLNLLSRLELDEKYYAPLLHPDFVQTELPNALNKNGQTSNYQEALQRMKIGRSILATQAFTIEQALESGDRAYVEARWSGTMAIDAGPLKKGQELRAHFCMAFELKDGKIYRQRNYDCFEPF